LGFSAIIASVVIRYWAKGANVGFSSFNARADKVATAPAFRAAWKAGRCLCCQLFSYGRHGTMAPALWRSLDRALGRASIFTRKKGNMG
jgi:hypothetical protein